MTNYQKISIVLGILLFGAASAYAIRMEDPNNTAALRRAFACGYTYAQYNDHRSCPEFSPMGKVTDINGQYGLIPP